MHQNNLISKREGLLVMDLEKRFGEIKAVNGIRAIFFPGKITGIVGPNGAGKTTLFNLITGELKPDKGRIFLNGEDITGLAPWRIARRGLSRLFQDVKIFKNMTVLENVLVSLQAPYQESPLFSILYPRKRKRIESSNIEEAEKWIEFVGLKEEKNKLGKELSFGQQKLLSIARLLAGGFTTFLLDEPTAGVHPFMIKKILELIGKMTYTKKYTIVIIEHNLSVLLDIADWLYFMHEGKIAYFGIPKHVLSAREVKEKYIGF